jgi:16S rRNA (guanine966-N2)-methyltransferase
VRVIGGRLGGRTFSSPHTNRTHPMSDKARGALFNALGEIDGLTLLDAFAGSGACSIEAVSRGVSRVLAIDIDPEAVKTIAENIRTLDLADEIILRRTNIKSWSRGHRSDQFDIVLADPPYDDIRPDVLAGLITNVRPGGLFVLSWPGSEPVREFTGLDVVRHKMHGDIQLVFYRRPG